jgi:hypothetical protein
MKVIALSVITLVSSIFLTTCEKMKIQAGIETNVNGYAIDSTTNKKLSNATVVVYGCKLYGFFQRSCVDSVTSTTTNSNGNFNIHMVSNGDYVGYETMIRDDEKFQHKNKVALKSGNTNVAILSAIELSVLRLQLKVLKNPVGELVVRTSKSVYYLKGQSNDVILDLVVYPNATNDVYYIVWDPKIGKYRRITDNIAIGAAPITVLQKTIPDTDVFPVQN